VCQQGTLGIIAAMTQGSVIRHILRHLKLAVDSPPIAPACQTASAWAASQASGRVLPRVRTSSYTADGICASTRTIAFEATDAPAT